MNENKSKDQLKQLWHTLMRLRIVLFVLLVMVLYGFIVLRISALSKQQPSQSAIDSQATATGQPSIDPDLVDKIKQLEDTNVSVHALFDEARNNPFQE